MSSERWDIEVNVVYEKSSVVDSLVVQVENLDAAQGSVVIQPPINTELAIGHNWQDQICVRLGGDWNILPGVLAVRGGFSYETSGFTGIGSTQCQVTPRRHQCGFRSATSLNYEGNGLRFVRCVLTSIHKE